MHKGLNFTVDSVISNWNSEFPQYILKPNDLKNPHALMEALFHIFVRLGIDRDFVLSSFEDQQLFLVHEAFLHELEKADADKQIPQPQENDCNECTPYYWDLVPVINMTRVVNHLLDGVPEVSATIMNFLQPTSVTSRSIIMLMFNLMMFYKERLDEIAPNEEVLFAKTEHVRTLESKKNKLLVMLNKQAEEKGERAQRLEKLGPDVKQFEEELKQEKEVHNEEKQQLDPILKENQQTEQMLEQKKTQRDALLAEVARKKTLRVYDAEDIKAQAEKAAQNVQEAEEKLNTLRDTLMQKESSLKNLQTIKPSLDTANNCLHEIMKLTDCLKDYESGDLDTDSKEGELDVLNTELLELQAQLSELNTARAEATEKRLESQAKRQNEKSQALSSLREAEEKDKKSRSRCKMAAQRTEEIKDLTLKYEEEKSACFEELAAIKNSFCTEIKTAEDMLIKKAMEVEKRVSEKLQNRKL